MNEFDFPRALRRHWIVSALVLAGAVVAGAILAAVQTPIYESSAQLIVAPVPGPMDTSDVIRSVETLERRTVVATFARIPATDDVRDVVAARLSLPASRAALYRTRGSVVPSTNIIRVDTQGPEPAIAAAIANASAEILAVQAQSLYRVYALRILSRATPPAKPAFPDRRRIILVALVIGLVLATAAPLAMERVRGTSA